MNLYTKKDCCLLFDLISKGDVILVNTVISFKPKLNVKDSFNRNALFYALLSNVCDNIKEEIVSSLIQAGKLIVIKGININENEKVEGHSPLTLSCSKNYINIVKLMLTNGANVNHYIKNGNI